MNKSDPSLCSGNAQITSKEDWSHKITYRTNRIDGPRDINWRRFSLLRLIRLVNPYFYSAAELLIRAGLGLSIFVLVPSLVFAAYLAFYATDRYQTEMRFVVRGATQPLSGAHEEGLGTRSSGAALIYIDSNQEAYIIANYIRSRAILDDSRGKLDFKNIFSAPEIDYWSRLKTDASEKELSDYWAQMVSADVDAVSGVVTVKVQAFSPENTIALAKAVLKQSEHLVNQMTEKLREDSIVLARKELDRAAAQVANAKLALYDFRSKEAIVDADKSAKSIFESIATLRDQRLGAETELLTSLTTLSRDAPTVIRIKEGITSINKQIEMLENELTGPLGAHPTTASQAIEAYDELKLDSDIADDRIAMAEDMLAAARNDFQAHHVYVDTFVPPALPQQPVYPRALFESLIFFGKLLVIWAIVALCVRAIREHSA